MVDGWRVETRDANLFVTGQVDVFTSLKVVLRHRRGGAWTMTLPADHAQAAYFEPGSGIVVWAPWSTTLPLFSGPVTKITTTTPTRDAGSLMTLEGVDDTATLADRIVLPDPASPMELQTTVDQWTSTNVAEKVIRDVVDYNAGAAAISYRRMCDADPSGRRAAGTLVGSTIAVGSRFENLLTAVDRFAAVDNLSVSLLHPGGATQQRNLYVTKTTDRSGTVRLSQDSGTITSATGTLTAPTATVALVAGSGEGVLRTLAAVNDNVSVTQIAPKIKGATPGPIRVTPVLRPLPEWGRRVEAFKDARGTDSQSQLRQQGYELLADAQRSAGFVVDPLQTSSLRFGYEYGLGDTIAVETVGLVYKDIVTAIDISVTANDGEVCKPVIGDAENADPKSPAIYAYVRNILQRLDNLERQV